MEKNTEVDTNMVGQKERCSNFIPRLIAYEFHHVLPSKKGAVICAFIRGTCILVSPWQWNEKPLKHNTIKDRGNNHKNQKKSISK